MEVTLYAQGNRDLREKGQKRRQEHSQHLTLRLSQRGEGLVYRTAELNVYRMRHQQTAHKCKKRQPLGQIIAGAQAPAMESDGEPEAWMSNVSQRVKTDTDRCKSLEHLSRAQA